MTSPTTPAIPPMVERVARALCDFEGAKWDAQHFNETPSGAEPEEMRDGYRAQARVAILAMREPTDGMVEAGDGTTDIEGLGFLDMGGSNAIHKLWRAAIDKALTP